MSRAEPFSLQNVKGTQITHVVEIIKGGGEREGLVHTFESYLSACGCGGRKGG